MKGRKKANYVTLKKNEILDSRLLTKKIIKIEAKARTQAGSVGGAAARALVNYVALKAANP
jgi:hypothetical protein